MIFSSLLAIMHAVNQNTQADCAQEFNAYQQALYEYTMCQMSNPPPANTNSLCSYQITKRNNAAAAYQSCLDRPLIGVDGFSSTGAAFNPHVRIGEKLGPWSNFPTIQFVSGDFDKDGRTEVAKIINDNGMTSIDVFVTAGAMSSVRWMTRSGSHSSNQWFLAGDYNGDGKTDIARVFPDAGNASIDVFLSTGNSFAAGARWTTKNGGMWTGQQYVAGDFNGDGKWDIARIWPDRTTVGNTYIDVIKSNGSGFNVSERWANAQGTYLTSQQWRAGNFNGDACMDLAKVFDDFGRASIDAHISSCSAFTMTRWETQYGSFSTDQKWIVADFTGDGLWDFANVFNDAGSATIDVHANVSGMRFEGKRWVTRSGAWNSAYSILPWYSARGVLRVHSAR